MNNSKEFLGTEPIGKLLFKLAVPSVIAQIVNMLYNIVDRIYIGHIPGSGSLALTGVGVCLPIIMVVSAFAALVGSGGAPRASIFMGKDDMDSAEKILSGCFTVQIIISAILTAVLLLFGRSMLLTFGASENTIDYAVDYMSIYAVGTIFVQMTLGMNMFITAQGFSKTSMLTVTIGAVCNIILDPIFIFGFGMGVKGAALATIISQAVSCGWVLAFLTGKKTFLRIKKEYLKPVPSIVFPCLALGLSTFVMQSSESVISVCFNSSLLKYGGDLAVGAMTILTSTMQFAMLPLQGIAQGAQPISSYNYGAKNISRVKNLFKNMLISEFCIGAISLFVFEVFPAQIVGIFGSGDDLYMEFATLTMRIYLSGIVFTCIQKGCGAFMQAVGKPLFSATMSLVREIVHIVLIIILPIRMGVMGVLYSAPACDVVAIIVTGVLTFRLIRHLCMSEEENTLKSEA